MGSNPTGTSFLSAALGSIGWSEVRLLSSNGLVAQWIARKTSNLKVAGSNPARVALFWLTVLSRTGGLAQSVECALCKREAPGSKPGFSILLDSDLRISPTGMASWPSG